MANKIKLTILNFQYRVVGKFDQRACQRNAYQNNKIKLNQQLTFCEILQKIPKKKCIGDTK